MAETGVEDKRESSSFLASPDCTEKSDIQMSTQKKAKLGTGFQLVGSTTSKATLVEDTPKAKGTESDQSSGQRQRRSSKLTLATPPRRALGAASKELLKKLNK